MKDNRGSEYHLNEYYETTYKDSLNQDHLEIRGEKYILYHMLLSEGADKHELHLCANNREVKSYALSTYIPDMKKKLSDGENPFYYIGYLAGDYLDKAVNMERSDFDFADGPLLGEATEAEVVDSAVGHILTRIKLFFYVLSYSIITYFILKAAFFGMSNRYGKNL